MSLLLTEVGDHVFYQCRKILGNQEDAEDAAQEILMTVFEKLYTLREPAAFWGWLNRMVANHCKNQFRGQTELQIPEDEEGNSLLDTFETLDEQEVPDKALDNDETARMIGELVDALSPEQRMCVMLYYYDEMSVKEIAEALNVSENTVKSRLNYARKSIKLGVEEHEKKGVKLYGLSPLPFLAYFLRREAVSGGLSAGTGKALAQSILSGAGTAAGSAVSTVGAGAATVGAEAAGAAEVGAATVTAASAGAGTATAAGAGGKMLFGLVSKKAAAGLLAGAVAVGGASAGITGSIGKQQLANAEATYEEQLSDLTQDYEAQLTAMSLALSDTQAEIDEIRPDSLDDAFSLLDGYMEEETARKNSEWISGVVDKASALAKNGDYDWALRLVDDGLRYFPENAELLKAKKSYTEKRKRWLFELEYEGSVLSPYSTTVTTKDGTVYGVECPAVKIGANEASHYIRVFLNSEYTTFTGGTYLLSHWNGRETIRFTIYGDGVELYDRRFPVEEIDGKEYSIALKSLETFALDVSGIDVIELRCYRMGDKSHWGSFYTMGDLYLLDFQVSK